MVDVSNHYNKTQQSLTKAVRLLMSEKGFCKEAVGLFGMDFTSGKETVITFDGEGEMCDMSIERAAEMTKDGIIECMSREISPYNIKRMKGELTDED